MTNKIKTHLNGFTMIELLAVIAIVTLLAALLFPSVHSVKKSALKARTKAQFQQYSLALEQYRLEHGEYPDFIKKSGENPISLAKNQESFIGALREFYNFTEQEFNNGLIVDALGNPNIYIMADLNEDGIIQTDSQTVHSPIIFYSHNENNLDYANIYSWK